MSRLIDADEFKLENKRLLHCDFPYLSEVTLEELIDDAPTVDAVPVRHGHWIGKPLAGYSTVKCSACGSAFVENNGKWKYCPDCGALMYESTQSNDSNTLDALGEKVME